MTTYWVIATKGGEPVDPVDGSWVPHPLNGLPVGDDPDFGHFVDGVEKSDETFLVVRLGEPGGVVEQTEGCPEKSHKRSYNYLYIYRQIWHSEILETMELFPLKGTFPTIFSLTFAIFSPKTRYVAKCSLNAIGQILFLTSHQV